MVRMERDVDTIRWHRRKWIIFCSILFSSTYTLAMDLICQVEKGFFQCSMGSY